MKYQKSVIAFAAALLAVPVIVSAQARPATDLGWYAGGSFGASQVRPTIDNLNLAAAGHEDRSDTGFKFFGGYQFHTNWAAEFQFQDVGQYTLTAAGVGELTLRARGYALSAVGTLPVSKDFSLLGKLGITRQDYKLRATAGGLSGSESRSKTSALVGVGAEYRLTNNLSVRGEYEYFGAPTQDIAGSTLKVRTSLLSVGLRYKF